MLGTSNSMEFLPEESFIIRSDFNLSKFMIRAPEHSKLDLYLNVCHGQVSLNA